MAQKKKESPLPVNALADPPGGQVVVSRLPLGSMSVPKRGMNGSVLVVEEPAIAEGSALALSDLQEIARLNSVGTLRPSRMLVALGDANSRLYLVPVPRKAEYDEDTLNVTYTGYGFRINLYKVFGYLERFVPTGMREIYSVSKTPNPNKLGEEERHALVIDLKKKPKLEPIHELTAEQKMQRKSRTPVPTSQEAE